MPILKRYIPLVLIGLVSACINVPEIEPPPDSGTSTTQPDAGDPGSGDAGSVDTERPSITRSIPANGSTNVALSARVELEFSEPMDVSTVQVSISPPVQFGAPTWSDGNTRLVIQPSTSLAQNVTYTINVDGKDVVGNTLTGTRTSSFSTTGPAPDTTPPSQLGFVPGNQATGAERTTSITVLFSEPMDKASVQSAFAITSPVGFNTGSFTWNESGTEMTFKPNTNFGYGIDVIWRVSTTAKDASGNTLQSAVTGTFRTLRTNTITIDFDPQTSGSLEKPGYYGGTHFYNLETVGDGDDNTTYRLFIGFKLEALPEDTIRINQGTLTWWITGQQGEPFKKFGNLLFEQVNVGERLDFTGPVSTSENPAAAADYHTTALSPPIVVPSNVASTQGRFDVTSLVRKDWSDRAARDKRSQFRLRFEGSSDNNNDNDRLFSDAERHPKLAEIEITYEYP